MAKIVFFCIPAYGHTNPTIEVVRELTSRGHTVRYYSYAPFQERIEAAGATFVSCDGSNPEPPVKPGEEVKVATDLRVSVRVIADATLAMDETVTRDMETFRPDVIVSDSVAFWGKCVALKLGIPFVSSTTTFAFNRYSVQVMKKDTGAMLKMLFALPSVNRDLKRLRDRGYPVKNVLSLLQNDNDTDTVVYTSSAFQPFAETFSDRYAFVGPSIRRVEADRRPGDKKRVYISMGTVNNRMADFYQNCIRAFADGVYDVTLSVGEQTDLAALGELPANIHALPSVDQIAVLANADAFLTHCGMNSVNEGLYYETPLVLYPQTAEQGGVANRVFELGAGLFLKENTPEAIRAAVDEAVGNPIYRENAGKIAESFRRAGGPSEAADAILRAAARK